MTLKLTNDDRKALRRRAEWIRSQLEKVTSNAVTFYRAELTALDKVLADQDERLLQRTMARYGLDEHAARERIEREREFQRAMGGRR